MKLVQRIGNVALQGDYNYGKTVAFFEEYKECIDEIAIFTRGSHAAMFPLDFIREDVENLKIRIADLHQRGFKSVGLNVWATIGHIDEDYELYGRPYQPIVGFNGEESKACMCPEDPEFKEYLKEKYTLYATTAPDFMWVDDDVKYFWNGVKFGCFCPLCMERFNKKLGTQYTREQLVEAMEQPGAVELRGLWVQDIEDRMTELFEFLRKTVDEVNPKIDMGFQTQHQGWSTYNGMNYKRWLPILGTKGRPGEGFYFDRIPTDVCTKALSTARQAAEYPESTTDVQYELENFPNYSFFQKSQRVVDAEITLAVAQGINGVLMNDFGGMSTDNGERPGDYVIRELAPYYAKMKQHRVGWDKMEEYGRGLYGRGFYPAISAKYDARRPLHNGESFFQTYENTKLHNVLETYTLGHIGVPLTTNPKAADGVVFTGNLPDGYTDEELVEFLKRPVIMDATALKAFERRGLEKYIGARWVADREDGIHEVFAKDEPINEGFEYFARDIHPAFFGGYGSILKIVNDDVIVLSYIEDKLGNRLGVGATLFENELGGKVCVLGYGAFQGINSLGRMVQMRRIVDYMTDGKQLTKFVDPCLAQQFVLSDDNKTMATIINMSMDSMDQIRYAIRGAKQATVIKQGIETMLEAEMQGDYGVFTIPYLEAFETCTFLV